MYGYSHFKSSNSFINLTVTYIERNRQQYDNSESESEVTQLCPTLCDPMDCSLPGSSIRGILQARVLEWVAISFSRRSSQPRDRTRVSHIAGRCFTIRVSKVTQSCPTLCDPVGCSLPGSSIRGILQAKTLEWVAIFFSRGSSQPRDRTGVSCIAGRCFTLWVTRGSPQIYIIPTVFFFKF